MLTHVRRSAAPVARGRWRCSRLAAFDQTPDGEDGSESEQLSAEDDPHHIDGGVPADLPVFDDHDANRPDGRAESQPRSRAGPLLPYSAVADTDVTSWAGRRCPETAFDAVGCQDRP